jgi:hypothetical protein
MTDAEEIQQTPPEVFEVEGVGDLRIAGLFLILALFTGLTFEPLGLFWISDRIVRLQRTFGDWVVWLPLIAYLLGLALILLGTSALFNWVQRRWMASYPGSITLQGLDVPRNYSFLAAIVILSSILVSILFYQQGRVEVGFILRMIWVSSGWAFGILLFFIGLNSQIPHYIWLGLVGTFLTTVALLLQESIGGSAVLVFGGWGLALGIAALLTLRMSLAKLGEVDAVQELEPNASEASES